MGVFFYKWTRNPHLKNILIFFFLGGGGEGNVQGRQNVRALPNVSNGTSTLQGEHLCKIILKSLHKCRSYGTGKLIYVTFNCDLELKPT